MFINRLSGRLDLLINQIKQNTDHDLIEDTDLLVYEDKGNGSIFFDLFFDVLQTKLNFNISQIRQTKTEYRKRRKSHRMISGKMMLSKRKKMNKVMLWKFVKMEMAVKWTAMTPTTIRTKMQAKANRFNTDYFYLK